MKCLEPLVHHGRMRIPTKSILFYITFALFASPLFAQSPWGNVATKLAGEFTGPIVRGFGLVAIVVGGLTLAFSEGGSKRSIGGLIFGLGMALSAPQFMAWLFA